MNATEREQFEAAMTASMTTKHRRLYADMINAQRVLNDRKREVDEATRAELERLFDIKRDRFLRSLVRDDMAEAETLLLIWAIDSRSILETLTYDDDEAAIEHNALAVLAVEYCSAVRLAVAAFRNDLTDARDKWLSAVRQNAREFAQKQRPSPASDLFLDTEAEKIVRYWREVPPDDDESF